MKLLTAGLCLSNMRFASVNPIIIHLALIQWPLILYHENLYLMNEPLFDPRKDALIAWTQKNTILAGWAISSASEDASFRRYFRIRHHDDSYIIMDAPPEKEDIHPFIQVTERLLTAGVQAPVIHQSSIEQGFLLLDDLGQQNYLSQLSPSTADKLYNQALETLLKIQQAKQSGLPPYDSRLLHTEMELFREWFLRAHLGISLNSSQHAELDSIFSILSKNALAQPQIFVHRDYHSRNLMVTKTNNPGVIDYQDAVVGPITYDLVSLLRDCYIAWPQDKVQTWALGYRDRLVETDLLPKTDDDIFLRWFDLMGLQRHLKAIGIFARLNHRDGKPAYLLEIPRVLNYILEVAARYADTAALADLLRDLKIKQKLIA